MVKIVSGLIFFSSNAAATVITLPVEPGSKTSCTEGLFSFSKVMLFELLGSNVGALA